ncbi:MAG: hypothetical protein F4221_05970 [Rhodothermaceae bacterium]|nr:hypothetical protein [Rhodothermaceae bacterium]
MIRIWAGQRFHNYFEPMTDRTYNKPDQSARDRLDGVLDEPCVNLRYSGMTMREMVKKVELRRDDPMDDSVSESEKIERE